MALPILARSPRYVVVAKPHGLTVHKSDMSRGEDRYALQEVRDQLRQHVFPVHRLDRPTSGCLLFALDSEAAAVLQGALAAEDAEKYYLAFVRGAMALDREVLVDAPLKDPEGRVQDAKSLVRCVGSAPQPRASLLLVRPFTGRFHQVRRHVRHLDHPVLGDSPHGDTRANKAWREAWGLNRLGLHCLSLDLPLPDGKRLQATCPVPEDLRGIWKQQPWWEDALARVPALGEAA